MSIKDKSRGKTEKTLPRSWSYHASRDEKLGMTEANLKHEMTRFDKSLDTKVYNTECPQVEAAEANSNL